MRDKRRIYSIAGTVLSALLIVFCINVLNEDNSASSDNVIYASSNVRSEVPVIRDYTMEGPGVSLEAVKEPAAEVPDENSASSETEAAEAETSAVSSASAKEETEAAGSSDAAGTETAETEAQASEAEGQSGYADGEAIGLSPDWEFASLSAISSGNAVYYRAKENRKDIVIAVNAGHGTSGGSSVKTYCHPDMTPKVTGGTTAAGATKAVAVSSGMTFKDGTAESTVTLRMARMLRDRLLTEGYDVLMLRDGEDVQLDNVARTVMANNIADCHIALHWDSDGLSSDKGCFFMSVPDGLKGMYPVSENWQKHEALGAALIEGLKGQGLKIWSSNPLDMDLTQTSFSTVASVDIELGNQCSSHTDEDLRLRAEGLTAGINAYFGY